MKINLTKYTFLVSIVLLFGIYLVVNSTNPGSPSNDTAYWSSKKSRVKAGEKAYMKPDGFIEYFQNVSKRIDEENNAYQKGYRAKALSNSFKNRSAKVNTFQADFTSRGPGNVGGRTRAIAVDPDDASHCTWYAGAASGGIWKTTDCGQSWKNISEGLPNLSTNSIAQATSNPDVLYVGTGEVFAGNSTFVRGDGIYKSVDRGASWSLLASTVDNVNYISVNRIAVDPSDENIVVIATNSGIYKSLNGGTSWQESLNAAELGSVQDLQVDPSDYSIQYAGVNGEGIFKSTDAGTTWISASEGIADGIRFEIAVAPSNPSILYTSTYVGSTTILYYSEDKAATWVKAVDNEFNTDFLGAQGWYDNAIEVNPYNPYEVFIGGVNIGKFLIDPNNIGESDPTFLGADEENTDFLDFIAFGAGFNGGTLDIADGNSSPSENPVTVEIRWGGTNSQKAHRFSVPENGGTDSNGGAGVPIADYTFEAYVDVPFEVWDIQNNRQLMVSFRDQENDGAFNLNARNDASDPDLLTAREYLYIHDIDYSASAPNTDVQTAVGGIEFKNMYYFWPILAQGKNWIPSSFSDAVLRLNYGSEFVATAIASAVYDAYGDYEGQNQGTLHPDHHNLTFVKTNEANEEFMVINGNDGAFGFSTDNGVTFEEREQGYVTSQFYGADKKPGEDKYIGGTQDNGTWVSSGSTVDANTSYNFVIGGDGFEVLWHATDTDLVMGTIYNNRILSSRNGGTSFSSSSAGIAQGDGPFITRLASSETSPDIVYAIGAQGVYKTSNFGQTWEMKPISNANWGGTSSSNDVEVSLANDEIVWAGAGMANGALDIFVSIDKGETYTAVNLPDIDPRAFTTGIYTHPRDENTAYVLFSVADQAKILKTEDLGTTWTDISGFGANAESSNGFPDVFTHSLLVMPFDTDVIWAGTEVGIFESLDGGQNWNIRLDMPSVSIWSMKVVDDQIVIGTHGRGIWTATIAELIYRTAAISAFDYEGYGNASVSFDLPVQYDKASIFLEGQEIAVLDNPAVGMNEITIQDFYHFDGAKLSLVAEFEGVEYESVFRVDAFDRAPQVLDFSTSIDLARNVYPVVIELENNEPFAKVEVIMNGELVHTDTQQLDQSEEKRIITFDYDQAKNNTVLIKSYINDFVFESETGFVTSSKDEIKSMFSIYPVPAKTTITVDASSINIAKYVVFTASGKLIKSSNANGVSSIDIDISEFNQGVYLLQLVDKKGVVRTKRFVKE